MAVVESDPERFLVAASEFIYLMVLTKELDDNLESIVTKDIEWRDTFIVSNNSPVNDVLADTWNSSS